MTIRHGKWLVALPSWWFLSWRCHGLSSNTPTTPLLPPDAYDTVLRGGIAVVPDFLSPSLVKSLRSDAHALYDEGHFTTDALSAYGSNGRFDPARDRNVLKLREWQRPDLGRSRLRHQTMAGVVGALRADLGQQLDRPGLGSFPLERGSTEISYTRFGPGAYLKRHLDEHHEELKGVRGWETPTRRSVSWLVYLNEPDWDAQDDGGELRCFLRRADPVGGPVGATDNGDLQIGWLKDNSSIVIERPVFLDAARPGNRGYCAMYVHDDATEKKVFISRNFDPDPVLYLSGADFFAQRLLLDNPQLASGFHFLEQPKSLLSDLLARRRGGPAVPSDPYTDEVTFEVPPMGGTLVLFDSVSLPHEVLASHQRDRWAASGWFHEYQQPEVYHPHHVHSEI